MKTKHKIKKPLIAVTTDHFSYQGYEWSGSPEQYLLPALEISGVIPLMVPTFGNELDFDSLLLQVDGVLITGAKSNVHPQNYHQTAQLENGPFDLNRDETSLKLIQKAVELGLPLLAICRGIQELNVALGGTLVHGVQNIAGRNDHRGELTSDNDKKFRLKHSVTIQPEGCLATLLETPSIQVNSVHEEGIDKLSDQLFLEARAPDGTVEAVSVKNSETFMLGVQWHPEYWVQTDIPSRKIFEAYGDAVRNHFTQRQNN